MKNKCTKFRNYRPYTAKPLGTWKMFDNPTDNHTDIEVPLYDKLRFHEAKKHDKPIYKNLLSDLWFVVHICVTGDHWTTLYPIEYAHSLLCLWWLYSQRIYPHSSGLLPWHWGKLLFFLTCSSISLNENVLTFSLKYIPQGLIQAGKLKNFGTRPNWVVFYIAYTKFHSPKSVFHSPGQTFTHIVKWASASFSACNWQYVSKPSTVCPVKY